MGYRLEISKVTSLACGNKLYGYIDPETLHKCKSWQWLDEHGYLDPNEKDKWTYGYSHEMLLLKDDFEEFIKLYIEDYNKYAPYGGELSLDDFDEALDEFCVRLEWA